MTETVDSLQAGSQPGAGPHPGRGPRLRPAIGVVALSAGIINLTIGAGIFALPGAAAEQLGARAWVAYLICAAAMTCVLLCFAVAGSRVTATGGPYMYVHAAFGPFPAFLAGALLWVAGLVASAAVATICADTLGAIVPAIATPAGRTGVLLAIYAVAILVNVRGVESGARTVTAVTLVKLLPLVGLVLIAGVLLLVGQLETAAPVVAGADPDVIAGRTLSVASAGRTALVLIFAFLGAEVALAPSGEVERPSRTVPLAIAIALGVVTILYLTLQATAQGVLGAALADDPATRAAPLVAVGTRLFGPVGAVVLTAATVISTAGYVLGDVLASPRLLYAFAADGRLPRALARLHPRHATPDAAIVLHGGLAALLAATGTFTTLVLMTNVAILVLYLGCCLAALVLLRREAALPPRASAGEAPGAPATRSFTPPFGPLVPLLACGVILWLLAQAQWKEFAAAAAAIGVAAVAYALTRRAAVARASGPELETD